MSADYSDEDVGELVLAALKCWPKARALYVEACQRAGQDPGPDAECWAEFERLDEALAPFVPVCEHAQRDAPQ